jgi:hypothetical protein
VTVSETSTWRPVAWIGFTDAATGMAVRDELRVSARFGRRTQALVRSIDGAAWGLHLAPEPPAGTITAHVDDPARRFLPAVATLPRHGSQLALASAPARAVPTGYAQVRATVLDRITGAPLPGLRLTVTVAGTAATGYADGRGDVLVCLPWPKTPASVGASSPLADRTWTASVKAAAPDPAPAAGRGFALDLAATYRDRRLAAKTVGQTALGEQTLAYGTPLVLTTEGEKALLVI